MRWVAVGLDDPYTGRFKNVAIADNEDLEHASFVIWDRVWKKTENADIERIKLIISAPDVRNKTIDFCLSLLNDVDQSCDANRILLYIEGELEKAKK